MIKIFLKKGLSFVKKFIIMTIGCIFYDKKYFKGINFSKYSYTPGWRWIKNDLFMQKIIGFNKDIPFPVHPAATIINYKNIEFDPEDLNIFQKSGNYYQANDAKIIIGKGTYIACNVGIITANHDLNDLSKHQKGKDVIIGPNSWIGLNSVILPGVHLGEHTIVGAGSVVTKSFPDGNCVIAGNPAKIIKKLN